MYFFSSRPCSSFSRCLWTASWSSTRRLYGKGGKTSPFIQRKVKNSSFIIIQMSEGADKKSTSQIWPYTCVLCIGPILIFDILIIHDSDQRVWWVFNNPVFGQFTKPSGWMIRTWLMMMAEKGAKRWDWIITMCNTEIEYVQRQDKEHLSSFCLDVQNCFTCAKLCNNRIVRLMMIAEKVAKRWDWIITATRRLAKLSITRRCCTATTHKHSKKNMFQFSVKKKQTCLKMICPF